MRPVQVSDKGNWTRSRTQADSDVNRAKRRTVNVLKEYIDRAKEIVGERTPDEEKYDREVIRWLRRGRNISKAITKANLKYPKEALQVNNDDLTDVEAYYEYLAEHETIMEKLDALKK